MSKRYTILAIAVFALLPLLGFNLALLSKPDSMPQTAMVFGAGILDENTPTAVLKNRLNKAIELYEDGDIETILVTGDNREESHNEPQAMKTYLLEQGIPEENIVQDFAGRRTIESCWRAKNVFGGSGVYTITQNFHLARATYLCRSFGLDVVPLEAKNASYQGGFNGYIREIPASWAALIESFNYKSATTGDGTEPQIN